MCCHESTAVHSVQASVGAPGEVGTPRFAFLLFWRECKQARGHLNTFHAPKIHSAPIKQHVHTCHRRYTVAIVAQIPYGQDFNSISIARPEPITAQSKRRLASRSVCCFAHTPRSNDGDFLGFVPVASSGSSNKLGSRVPESELTMPGNSSETAA